MVKNETYTKFCLEVDNYFVSRGFSDRKIDVSCKGYNYYIEQITNGKICVFYNFFIDDIQTKKDRNIKKINDDFDEVLIKKMVGYLYELIYPFIIKYNIPPKIIVVSIGSGYRYLINGERK